MGVFFSIIIPVYNGEQYIKIVWTAFIGRDWETMILK